MWRTALLCLWPAVVVAVAADLLWKQYALLVVLWYHALCLFIPLVVRRPLGEMVRDTGLERWDARRWALPAAAIGAAMIVGIWAGVQFLKGWQMAGYEAGVLIAGGNSAFDSFRPLVPNMEPLWLVGFYAVAVNPVVEEYYWRGFLLPRSGVLWGAFFFWLTHYAAMRLFLAWHVAFLLSVPVFAAGAVWGWMRRRYGSLWPCILTHFAADLAIVAAALQLR